MAHIRAAYLLTVGSAPTKAVLICLADSACEHCGFAWPGSKFMAERTELGETRIRQSVDELVSRGLLRIHAYGKGGRGRATEFVVLPHLPGLSTAPCAECYQRMKRPRAALGL